MFPAKKKKRPQIFRDRKRKSQGKREGHPSKEGKMSSGVNVLGTFKVGTPYGQRQYSILQGWTGPHGSDPDMYNPTSFDAPKIGHVYFFTDEVPEGMEFLLGKARNFEDVLASFRSLIHEGRSAPSAAFSVTGHEGMAKRILDALK